MYDATEGHIPLWGPFVSAQHSFVGFPEGSTDKESTCDEETQETQVQSLDQKDPLEEEMATPSSILAWKIPWTEEPCGLQSMGSQRVGHN